MMKRIITFICLMLTAAYCNAQYAPQAGISGSTAISASSSLFVGWATQCTVQRGYMDIAQPSLGYVSAGDSSLAIGRNAATSQASSTALGAYSSASGLASTAIGKGASAQGEHSTALGLDSQAAGANGLALGAWAGANHANSVALGAGSATDRNDSVSIGNANLDRQLTHVADGTQANDATEAAAIHQVFGPHAPHIPLSSTKSLHGHSIGASGALEALATILALKENLLPANAGVTEIDPALHLDVILNQPREAKPKLALSNSLAFGGLNAVLALRPHP